MLTVRDQFANNFNNVRNYEKYIMIVDDISNTNHEDDSDAEDMTEINVSITRISGVYFDNYGHYCYDFNPVYRMDPHQYMWHLSVQFTITIYEDRNDINLYDIIDAMHYIDINTQSVVPNEAPYSIQINDRTQYISSVDATYWFMNQCESRCYDENNNYDGTDPDINIDYAFRANHAIYFCSSWNLHDNHITRTSRIDLSVDNPPLDLIDLY